MTLSGYVQGFLRSPMDPNQDGKTSLGEWFAFVGLMAVLAYAWKRILDLMLEE